MNESQNQSGTTTLQYVAFQNLYEEPTFKIDKSKGIIQLGEDNALPAYVIDLIDKSPEHQSAIVGKIMFANGVGLVPPKNNPKAEKMFANGEPNLAAPNNLNEIQIKLLSDLVVHGHCSLSIRWNDIGTEIVDVNYLDVTSVRLDANETSFLVSEDWSNTRKYPPVPHAAFSMTGSGAQSLYVKMPSPKTFPYGMPSYWSARHAIELQYELMSFNLNRTKNNFFVSVLINFDDLPLDEKQRENHKKVKEFFTGSKGKNVGGALMQYGQGVTVTPFESGSGPKDFVWMETTASQKIKSAHGVTGSLFGMGRGADVATFSSADELLNEVEVFSKMQIRPYQTAVLSIWNMIGQINSINHTWEIDPFVLFERDRIKTGDANNPGTDVLPALGAPVDGVAPAATVAETAMNGSQVESLLSIVSLVSEGKITKATAAPLIKVAFPSISAEAITAMLDGTDKAQPQIPLA